MENGKLGIGEKDTLAFRSSQSYRSPANQSPLGLVGRESCVDNDHLPGSVVLLDCCCWIVVVGSLLLDRWIVVVVGLLLLGCRC